MSAAAYDGLASRYDSVCVGTSIALTAISSALSKHGLKVLHLDNQDQYGSRDGTVSLHQLLQPSSTDDATSSNDPHSDTANSTATADANNNIALVASAPLYSSYNVLHPPDPVALPASQHRHYLFDLRPQLLYSRGRAVEAMIQQDVSSYVDFSSVDVLSLATSDTTSLRFQAVPTTRSQLFADQQLSGEEKHQLMRVLQSVMASQQSATQPAPASSFTEYLQSLALTPRVSAIIQYILAMDRGNNDIADANIAIQCMKLLLDSCGRYSSVGGAFLSPQYGLSEVSSAFARSSAVHGAVFLLRIQPTRIATEQLADGTAESATRRVRGIALPNGQLIQASHIITEPRFLRVHSNTSVTEQQTGHARLVASFILRHSLATNVTTTASATPGSQLHIIPPHHPIIQNRYPIHVIEHRAGSGMLPNTSSHCVAQAMTVVHPAAADEMQRLLTLIKQENQEQVLYAGTHTVKHDQAPGAADQPAVSGLHVASSSNSNDLLEDSMVSAQSIIALVLQQHQQSSSTGAATSTQPAEREIGDNADELDELDAILL